jgi:hypothetical protein
MTPIFGVVMQHCFIINSFETLRAHFRTLVEFGLNYEIVSEACVRPEIKKEESLWTKK